MKQIIFASLIIRSSLWSRLEQLTTREHRLFAKTPIKYHIKQDEQLATRLASSRTRYQHAFKIFKNTSIQLVLTILDGRISINKTTSNTRAKIQLLPKILNACYIWELTKQRKKQTISARLWNYQILELNGDILIAESIFSNFGSILGNYFKMPKVYRSNITLVAWLARDGNNVFQIFCQRGMIWS